MVTAEIYRQELLNGLTSLLRDEVGSRISSKDIDNILTR